VVLLDIECTVFQQATLSKNVLFAVVVAINVMLRESERIEK